MLMLCLVGELYVIFPDPSFLTFTAELLAEKVYQQYGLMDFVTLKWFKGLVG